jgi:hypothetical protein
MHGTLLVKHSKYYAFQRTAESQARTKDEKKCFVCTVHIDGVATRWSAQRLLPDEVEAEGLFTAEHVYPWMWQEYAELRPQQAAAELLAAHPWPALYDPDRLRRNDVPVAATIYVNDLFVDRDFAEETASAIGRLRTWQTDEYEHNGLRADGERVLGRLIDLVRGRA